MLLNYTCSRGLFLAAARRIRWEKVKWDPVWHPMGMGECRETLLAKCFFVSFRPALRAHFFVSILGIYSWWLLLAIVCAHKAKKI
jgi:hypothetical protein